MNVVHISTDDYTGGASIAAFRLHKKMIEESISSSMLVLRKAKTQDETIFQFKPTNGFKILARVFSYLDLYNKFVKFNTLKGMFSIPFIGNNIVNHPVIVSADVVFIHWINSNFLNMANIEKILLLGKPVYIVLHDMWPMTGGCHHSFECEKYKTNCFHCPNLINPSPKDWSYYLFRKKLKVYGGFNNLKIITPSRWLGKCALGSKLFSEKTILVLPNIVDTRIYKPIEKRTARSLFNLPQERIIILFGAIEGTYNPFKGWSYLLEALKILVQRELKMNAFILGSNYNKEIAEAIPFPSFFSGHLHDVISICMLYNAVDVFVAPSLAETFGNSIAESLACGTPVVGFDVGGIPDLIDHKKNGYLANYRDSSDLANGILWVLNNHKDLREPARKKIENMMNEVSLKINQLKRTY